MKNLQLVKSENFGDIQCDIYSDGNDVYMTTRQLYECLEESKGTFDSRISRNPYLKDLEFSVTCNLQAPDGKRYNTRVFNEDGLYEIAMLSESEKAKEFRAWIRKVLKALRKGDAKIISTRRSLGEINSAARIITQTLKEAGMPPEFRAITLKSLYAPAGVEIPLDGITAGKRTYDATTIAKTLGVYSKSGKPHNKAIVAIISVLDIANEDTVLVPYQNMNSGHSGENVQYTDKVVSLIESWLEIHEYPQKIILGNRSYSVVYRERKSA